MRSVSTSYRRKQRFRFTNILNEMSVNPSSEQKLNDKQDEEFRRPPKENSETVFIFIDEIISVGACCDIKNANSKTLPLTKQDTHRITEKEIHVQNTCKNSVLFLPSSRKNVSTPMLAR